MVQWCVEGGDCQWQETCPYIVEEALTRGATDDMLDADCHVINCPKDCEGPLSMLRTWLVQQATGGLCFPWPLKMYTVEQLKSCWAEIACLHLAQVIAAASVAPSHSTWMKQVTALQTG